MAAKGPPPKRSDQRRRTNSPAAVVTKVANVVEVVMPPADEDWHPVALRWYLALGSSGQSAFYVDSDWATAYATAEAMSREFKPQPLIVGRGEHAVVEMHAMPPKAAFLVAWLKASSMLLATEGDRRRLSVELERPKAAGEGEGTDVSELADFRARLRSG